MDGIRKRKRSSSSDDRIRLDLTGNLPKGGTSHDQKPIVVKAISHYLDTSLSLPLDRYVEKTLILMLSFAYSSQDVKAVSVNQYFYHNIREYV